MNKYGKVPVPNTATTFNKGYVTVGNSNNYDYVTDGTDDDVQIQEAIDYINGLGGGIVLITQGSYDIGSEIELKNNVKVSGTGEGTILTLADGVNGYVFKSSDIVDGHDNIEVSNIKIDCNGSNQTGGGGINFDKHATPETLIHEGIIIRDLEILNPYLYGVLVQGMNGGSIINNKIVNGDFGIWVAYSQGVVVNKNNLIDVALHKIVSAHGSEGTIITNNFIKNYGVQADGSGVELSYLASKCTVSNNLMINTYTGILVRGSDNNSITSNIIKSCNHYGINLSNRSGFGGSISNTVSANIIFECLRGIYNNEQQNVLIGNTIELCEQEGIYVTSASYTNIQGNVCVDNGTDTSNTYSGIKLVNSNRCLIAGNLSKNSATSNQKYGLELSSCDNTIFGLNQFTGNNTAHQSISGSTNAYLGTKLATSAPGTGDDINDGYFIGSIRIDTSGEDAYICIDATAGSALWKQITP